jgi:hypothetical protein
MQVAPIDLRPFRERPASQRRDVTAAFDQPIEAELARIVEDRAADRGHAVEGTDALAYSREQDLRARVAAHLVPTLGRANDHRRRDGASR